MKAGTGVIGSFGSKIGLIGLGAVGRKTAELIGRGLDVEILIYDPFASNSDCSRYQARKAELMEIFETCDVISMHAPDLPKTRKMCCFEYFSAMKRNATFINTARGTLVDEGDLIEVANKRKDLNFYLDVTCPEPPPNGSPLYELSNVVLTPHLAGSRGNEHRRLGRIAVEECHRYLKGESLVFPVTRKLMERQA